MTCRACGSLRLEQVLDVGAVAAADHFPRADTPVTQSETGHPLSMALCRLCSLAQLVDDDTTADEPRGVEPQALRDQAAAALADAEKAGLLVGTTAAEFGSPHGGTWLPLLTDLGLRTRRPDAGPSDVVLDCFGMMHEPDQAAAAAQRARATARDGVLLFQFHSVAAIVEQGQWNALRHGHFAYYSLAALQSLFAAVGMTITSAWTYDLYGGTVMLAIRHGDHPVDPSVGAVMDAENRAGVTDPQRVGTLQAAAQDQWTALREWLTDAAADGGRVYAYAAASRAVALFAGAHITKDLLAGVADASPAKWGLRMPGTDIPIIDPDSLVEARPTAVLVTVPDLVAELRRDFPSLADVLVTEPPSKVSGSNQGGTP
ncbi:methyltransferase C-terminal domain-containing protein [Williamsia deligens]|uniref:Methyltransferase C-terminal domain-containing protein n=1 Tax=Williamsia deligens TaxID=321325 RepID=A0ABW3G4I0_9NOCA|nr:methyltransferase C-terminal domain-containing protein [Williamsia deligens]MCP2194186.1 putative zinc binding domain-containing protein [Williamsia deligens]